MKKNKSLIIAIVLMLFCLVGCSTINNNTFSTYIYDNSDKYSVGESEFEKTSVEKIDIDWISHEVNVVKNSSIDKIKIYESIDLDTEDDYKMHYYLNGNKLMIKMAASMSILKHTYSLKTLFVEIPADMNFTDVNIDTVSANVIVNNITCDELGIDSVSGVVEITNTSVKNELNIDNISGNIKLETVTCNDLDVDNVSGELDATDLQAITLDVDTISGAIELDIINEPTKITIESTSGSTKIKLINTIGFEVTFDSVSGSFKSDFATTVSGDTYTCGDGSLDIDVDTVSGSLTINK